MAEDKKVTPATKPSAGGTQQKAAAAKAPEPTATETKQALADPATKTQGTTATSSAAGQKTVFNEEEGGAPDTEALDATDSDDVRIPEQDEDQAVKFSTKGVEAGTEVLYVIPRGPSKGKTRYATVSEITGEDTATLTVQFDSRTDGELYKANHKQVVRDVKYNEDGERGTFKLV